MAVPRRRRPSGRPWRVTTTGGRVVTTRSDRGAARAAAQAALREGMAEVWVHHRDDVAWNDVEHFTR